MGFRRDPERSAPGPARLPNPSQRPGDGQPGHNQHLDGPWAGRQAPRDSEVGGLLCHSGPVRLYFCPPCHSGVGAPESSPGRNSPMRVSMQTRSGSTPIRFRTFMKKMSWIPGPLPQNDTAAVQMVEKRPAIKAGLDVSGPGRRARIKLILLLLLLLCVPVPGRIRSGRRGWILGAGRRYRRDGRPGGVPCR